jgi:hypothetical protein
VFLQHGVNYKWVTTVCVSLVPIGIIASYEIDDCVISLFHCVSIMEASCMLYLIASSVMKLGFYIMVSLQSFIG